MFRMLIINPGSTSTKIAVYDDLEPVFVESFRHSAEDLAQFDQVIDQLEFRKKIIEAALAARGIDGKTISAAIGRGGLIRPIESGTYEINKDMVQELKQAVWGSHAANLGAVLAFTLAEKYGIPSYIVDPVVVDELEEIARVSGLCGISRKSIFHALNQKAVARRYASQIGRNYEDLNLIIAHMGGGVSVGAHKKGKVIDVNNALDGDGPFSPERTGGLPAGELVSLCFSGKFTQDEIKKKLSGKGGLVSYFNTNDALQVQAMIDEGDSRAEGIYKAMAYQAAKEIGACSAVLKGEVDAIILTGGLAYSKLLTGLIREMTGFICDLVEYPGEDEILALAEGGYRVLSGAEPARIY